MGNKQEYMEHRISKIKATAESSQVIIFMVASGLRRAWPEPPVRLRRAGGPDVHVIRFQALMFLSDVLTTVLSRTFSRCTGLHAYWYVFAGW